MSLKSKTFQVRVCQHPVDRSNAIVNEVLYRQQTVRQVVKTFAPDREVLVVLNHKELSREQWAKTRVRSNDVIDLVPQVGFLPLIWAAATWLWTEGIILNLALGFLFSYLGGLLFAQDVKESDTSSGSQNYSWNPKTTHREGSPRPRPYGETMMHGNIIASWTDVSDESEVLYAIVDHGEGPIEGLGSNDVYLNDQASANYSNVTIQERLGTMDQTCMTGFEKTKIEYTLGRDLTVAGGPLTFTTPNDWVDDLEFTISYPNGLIKYHKDGEVTDYTVNVQVEISEKDAGLWSSYTITKTAHTRSSFYRNVKLSDLGFTCTHGLQYDLRFSRLTADDPDTRRSSNVQIKSVREVVNTAMTYPGRALIGISALGTESLSGSFDVKCVRRGRIVNTYNGSDWVLQYSNNLAWVVFDILTMPVISGSGESGDPYAIERYEGINPTNVDTAFFYEWAQVCATVVPDGKGSTEELFVCNYILDQRRSLFSTAHELAQMGRTKLYWEGTTLTGWTDKAVAAETDLITDDAIISKSWRSDWIGTDELAGQITISYNDEDRGYERTTYQHSNENSGVYSNIINLDASGETRFSGVVRFGTYALKKNQLCRNVNTFLLHKDAIRNKLGDVVRIQRRLPNWGQAFRVISVGSGTNSITVDREVEDVVAGDLVYIRAYNSTSSDLSVDVYTVDSVSGSTITVTELLDPIPTTNSRVAIASSTSGSSVVTKLRRITKMVMQSDGFFEVTCETYDDAVFDGDALDPSNPYPDYVWPSPAKSEGLTPKPLTWKNVSDAVEKVVRPAADTNIPTISNVTWTSGDSGSGEIIWTVTDDDFDVTFRYQGTSHIITIDSGGSTTTDKFVYWDPSDPTVFSTTDDEDTLFTLLVGGCWVVCVNDGGIAYPAVPMQVIHAGLIIAGTIRTKHLIAEAVTTPKIAADAVSNTSSSYTDGSIAVSSSEVTVAQADITTEGGRVFLSFYCAGQGTGGTGTFYWRVYRDATEIYEADAALVSGSFLLHALAVTEEPEEGTYTYYVKMVQKGTRTGEVKHRTLLVQEFKR